MENNRLIFCFGSNTAGHHGAGAARYAVVKFGAEMGVGYGFSGYSFAVPTKDHQIQTLPLETVAEYVEQFKKDADENPDLVFAMTKIGCGLAGFTDDDIAPLFAENVPFNVDLPLEWAMRNKNASWRKTLAMLATDYPKLGDPSLFMLDSQLRSFAFRNDRDSKTYWFEIDRTKPITLQVFEQVVTSGVYEGEKRTCDHEED